MGWVRVAGCRGGLCGPSESSWVNPLGLSLGRLWGPAGGELEVWRGTSHTGDTQTPGSYASLNRFVRKIPIRSLLIELPQSDSAWTVTVKVERAPSGWDSVLEDVFPRPHVYFPCASSLCSLPRGVGMGPIFPLQGVKRSPRLPAGDPSGALGTEECTQPTGVEAPQACTLASRPKFTFLI